MCTKKKIEDTKKVIKSRKSKMNRQHNSQRTNKDPQNTTQKTKD